MAFYHGVKVEERSTSISTTVVASTSVPFVVGVAPVHQAEKPAAVGIPVICTSWDEYVEKFGYCEDWDKFPICEFAYTYFILFSMQPAIFVNLYDPAVNKTTSAAKDYPVDDHKVNLGSLAMTGSTLVVKSGSATLSVDTDYKAYYFGGELIVELLSDGSAYESASLNIAYTIAKPEAITTNNVATGFDKVELCMTTLGVIPSLLCAPGYSDNATVAAVMASKAASINGLFRAKALVDIPCGSGGALVYSDVLAKKNSMAMTDLNQVVCWPMLGMDGKKYHMSSQLAGLIASVDAETGTPYASPSNHGLKCDSLIVADGTEVLLTMTQANMLNAGGIMTGLNFMGGFVAWGNYTACYPVNTDVKDYFIPVSRVFDWVANTLIQTFWGQLDKPMTRRLVDSIMDSANIWLNGLTGSGYILGGRVTFIESENPLTNLMAGIIKLHVYITPPSPAQEIDFVLEYDASYVEQAFAQ